MQKEVIFCGPHSGARMARVFLALPYPPSERALVCQGAILRDAKSLSAGMNPSLEAPPSPRALIGEQGGVVAWSDCVGIEVWPCCRVRAA
jgi:hypothetical protein